MAATPTRRVLGVLDANKPIPSPMLSTPSKRTAAASSNVSAVKDVAPSLQKLRSPTGTKTGVPSPAPLNGVKRKQAQEDDAGSPKRQRALSPLALPAIEVEAETPVHDIRDDPNLGHVDRQNPTEQDDIRSSHGSPQETPSPFAIFDTTDNTQITVMTEPDVATVPLPAPTLPISPAPRAITQEARENAEALRLRLKVAMYKVRTNQISLPLSQLSVVHSHPRFRRGAKMPSMLQAGAAPSDITSPSRSPAPATTSSMPIGQRGRLGEIPQLNARKPQSPRPQRPAASPSSSPWKESRSPARNLSTPVLPRSRDGLAPYGDWDGAGDGDLTSSVVKKGAADGLLRLMACGFEQR